MAFKSSFYLLCMEKSYSIEEIEKIVEKELREGRALKEIGAIIGRCRDNVAKIKKQLVEKGVITEEEIERAKNERNKKTFLEDPITQEILKYVRAGLPQDDIANLVDRAQGVVSHKITLLKQYGVITQDEIDEARRQYMQEIKSDNFRRDYILENLRKGRLKGDIADELGMTYKGIEYVQNSLIAEGRITKEEIDKATIGYKKEMPKTKKRRKILEKDEQEIDNKILIGLSKGYSQKRIATEMFEEGEISQTGVGKRIKRLIDKGIITQKQIEQYKDKAKQRVQAQKEKEEKAKSAEKDEQHRKKKKALERVDNRLIKLLLDGDTIEETAEKLEYAKTTVGKKIKRLKDEGLINQEELDAARAKRRQQEKERTIRNREKAKKEREKQEKKEVQKQEELERQEKAYRENLKRAKKILHSEAEVSDEKINKVVRELINFLLSTVGKERLNKDEITIITDALFEAIKMDVNNILGIAKLWIMVNDYKESIYILNYSKNFFDGEEDLAKIDKAVEMITIYRRKLQADKMLRDGVSLEEIVRKTKLSLADLIQLKNRKDKLHLEDFDNKKTTDSQGDSEVQGL